MSELTTIAPMQLPTAPAISDDAFTFIFRPGGPLQKIPHSQLLAKLISTDLAKLSRALLNADLGWDADTVALVYNDPTAALNGWYRKTGASGAGTWTQFETLAMATKTAAEQAAAAAAVSAASAAAMGRYYTTCAAGVAATAVGEMFTSDETGILAIYKRTGGAPFFQFYSNVPTDAVLALKTSIADLAAPTGAALVGVKAPGVGASVRALQDKLAEAPSISDFLTPQIAVDVCILSGRALLVDDMFVLTAPLVVSGPLRLFAPAGGDPFSNGFSRSGAGDLIQVNTANSVTISGLGLLHSGPSGEVVKLITGESHEVSDCELRATNAAGVGPMLTFRGSNTYIENNRFTNLRAGQWTIIMDRTAGLININSAIRENYFGGTGKGVLVYSSDGSPRPEGFEFSQNSCILTGGYQLEIRALLGLRFSNNMMDQATDGCVYFNPDAGNVEGIDIAGPNYLSTAAESAGVGGGVAIGVNAAAAGKLIDVSISGPNTIAQSAYGISFPANVEGFKINDVIFSVIDQTAITIQQAKTGTIQNNQFRNLTSNMAIADGAAGGPYNILGNQFQSSAALTITATDKTKFNWRDNTGKKTSGWAAAATPTINAGTSSYLAVPHGLAAAPSAERIVATVLEISGGFTGVSWKIDTIDATNITFELYYAVVVAGVLQVNVWCEL